jgi:hypothetical protein
LADTNNIINIKIEEILNKFNIDLDNKDKLNQDNIPTEIIISIYNKYSKVLTENNEEQKLILKFIEDSFSGITKGEKHFNFVQFLFYKTNYNNKIIKNYITSLESIFQNENLTFSNTQYINFLEHILDKIITNLLEFDFRSLLENIEIKLIQLYMNIGDYKRCFETSEHLKMFSNNKEIKANALISMLETSIIKGDIEIEKKLLSKLKEEEDIISIDNLWFYLAEFFAKTNANHTLEVIDNLLDTAKDEDDIDLKFKWMIQAIKCYFYLGNFDKAMEMVNLIKSDFKNYLNENATAKIHLNHSIVITMHNVDKNNFVVENNLNIKEGYKKINDRYNYLLSCVNLADGYMGLGKLDMAIDELEKVYEEAKTTTGINAKNIISICYANALTSIGKASVALIYYEEGIQQSKQIEHYWDLYYGQIWRAYSLAEFYEYSAVDKLLALREKCLEKGYSYLYNLASGFALVSAQTLNNNTSMEVCFELLNSIDSKSTPGIKSQAIAAYITLFGDSVDNIKNYIDEMIELALLCEGIKGKPQLIANVVKDFSSIIEKDKLEKINKWIEIYVNPVLKTREIVDIYNFNELDKRPLLTPCNIKKCPAPCCYDGVYMKSEEEEEKIKKFVESNKDYFKFLPKEYIKYNNWRNLAKGMKTTTRPFKNKMINYPKHFTNTRCVFAFDDGVCSLQRLATDLDYHPWKFKPEACWMYPITAFPFGEPMSPPKREDKDLYYIDESYPGYSKFLPCSIENADGKPWYEVYKQEILYGKFIFKDDDKV